MQNTRAILFSLALRIVRVYSNPKDRGLRLSELRDRLIARSYNTNMVEAAIGKARLVPRYRALQKRKQTNKSQRPI